MQLQVDYTGSSMTNILPEKIQELQGDNSSILQT